MSSQAGRSARQELALARRRLASAREKYWAAHSVIEAETRRIALLEARLNVGPGHVLTRDPKSRYQHPAYAYCRYCSAPAGSPAGTQPCPGDSHCCSAEVAEGETSTAFRVHRGGWNCGQPGQYDTSFTAWTCTAGHVIAAACPSGRHVSGPLCACYGLITVVPA